MISLTIPAPCPPINSNQRLHFRVLAHRTRLWREATAVRAQAASLEQYPHAHVRAFVGYPDARSYDAGILKDDSDRYVIGPDMRTGDKAKTFALTLTFDPDCRCRDCAYRFGPRLALITNQGGTNA